MKWMSLLVMVVFVSGCCCTTTTTTDIVEYRQVTVAPVVESVIVNSEIEPIDVTTTTIDFY